MRRLLTLCLIGLYGACLFSGGLGVLLHMAAHGGSHADGHGHHHDHVHTHGHADHHHHPLLQQLLEHSEEDPTNLLIGVAMNTIKGLPAGRTDAHALPGRALPWRARNRQVPQVDLPVATPPPCPGCAATFSLL